MKTLVVRVDGDGSMRELEMDQRDIYSFLDGPLCFVGAIESLQAFLVSVALVEGGVRDENTNLPTFVDTPCCGPIFVVGSDADGCETSVSMSDVQRVLDENHRPTGDSN